MDFSEYRPYQPGDDLRALDWKVFGRTDRLFTKLYVPEQEETVCFLLDTSASMTPKWSAVQTLVLGLASVVLGQGDRVAMVPLLNPELPDLRGLPPARGRSNLARVSKFLDDIQPSGLIDLAGAFQQAARRLKTRSHLIVVSDFLQEGAGLAGLAQLRYRRHRMTLVQLLSPQEQTPKMVLSPGEWELFDPERGGDLTESVRLDLGDQSFVQYAEKLSEHIGSLRTFCRLSGAVFVSAASDFHPLSFFSEDLRKVGLLS